WSGAAVGCGRAGGGQRGVGQATGELAAARGGSELVCWSVGRAAVNASEGARETRTAKEPETDDFSPLVGLLDSASLGDADERYPVPQAGGDTQGGAQRCTAVEGEGPRRPGVVIDLRGQ